MEDTELRKAAESMRVGDKATLGILDFEFTVTETIGDPNDEFVNIFAEKDHHPKEGLFTQVEFGVDISGNVTGLLIRVYEEEEYRGELVEEEKYETFESISVLN